MDSNELKPCPFCGWQPEEVNCFEDGKWELYCKNEDCFILPGTYSVNSEAEAIRMWNTRKGDDSGSMEKA